MKKISVILIVAYLILILASPALAAPAKVIDDAGLLTEDEVAHLEFKAQEISSRYDMDVVILTVASTGGKSIRNFADDFYDENGYGIGSDYSGVLFMLAMDTREWYISTCGDGIYAVTDYGVQMLFSGVATYLSQDDYFTAFDVYLDELEEYYREFAEGDPIDGFAPEYDGPGSYVPNYDDEIIYYDPPARGAGSIIFTSLLIGVIVGAVALLIMRSGMKTAKRQSGAYSYLSGNVNITRQHHHYLYSTTSRTAKPQNSNGGGSRGGGSGTHVSSGGRSHGGGGGRF